MFLLQISRSKDAVKSADSWLWFSPTAMSYKSWWYRSLKRSAAGVPYPYPYPYPCQVYFTCHCLHKHRWAAALAHHGTWLTRLLSSLIPAVCEFEWPVTMPPLPHQVPQRRRGQSSILPWQSAVPFRLACRTHIWQALDTSHWSLQSKGHFHSKSSHKRPDQQFSLSTCYDWASKGASASRSTT